MSITDIISFLLPYDIFQYLFLSIILFLALWNIWGVKTKANLKHWQDKWENGSQNENDDDIDSAHGSVIDISQAVATAPEKLAEIMPGLLLVIGLLGTFVGLGIALNKASEILSQAKSAGMDTAMSNMMQMMQGLGTKFKTSTWGIIGFLSFKAWMSVNNFEEHRLKWTISRMKFETSGRRKAQMELDEKRYMEHKESEKNQNKDLINAIVSSNKMIYDLFISHNNLTNESRKKDTDILKSKLEEIKNVKTGIEKIITLESAQSKDGKALVSNMLETKNNILLMKDAVTDFINANKENVIALKESGIKMASSAKDIGASAGKLDKAIDGFQEKVSEVLNDIKGNLGETIKIMNSDFTKNLNVVSKNLGESTKEISKAVSSMSGGVKETLDKVGTSITSTIDTQKKAFVYFETTSETLNENIQTSTSNLQKVMDKIELSLSAVSDKRQEMKQASDTIKEAMEHTKAVNLVIERIVGDMEKTKLLNPKIHEEICKTNNHLFSIDNKIKKINQFSPEKSK